MYWNKEQEEEKKRAEGNQDNNGPTIGSPVDPLGR